MLHVGVITDTRYDAAARFRCRLCRQDVCHYFFCRLMPYKRKIMLDADAERILFCASASAADVTRYEHARLYAAMMLL